MVRAHAQSCAGMQNTIDARQNIMKQNIALVKLIRFFVSTVPLLSPLVVQARGFPSENPVNDLFYTILCSALIFAPFGFIKTRSGCWKYSVALLAFLILLLEYGNGSFMAWLFGVLCAIAEAFAIYTAVSWDEKN